MSLVEGTLKSLVGGTLTIRVVGIWTTRVEGLAKLEVGPPEPFFSHFYYDL
ncbi:uncharacterized protein G2W53_022192 [Senna tora]|uniref:Uncharacterized protein n=1 Tax=Senna tora TaxID=362788 RepID=A0A834TKT7_9FABA|nr:uncharacterized protein G2W53_022192 [Senna tora]